MLYLMDNCQKCNKKFALYISRCNHIVKFYKNETEEVYNNNKILLAKNKELLEMKKKMLKMEEEILEYQEEIENLKSMMKKTTKSE